MPFQARSWLGWQSPIRFPLNKQCVSYIVDQKMKRVMLALHEHPEDLHCVEAALLVARPSPDLPSM